MINCQQYFIIVGKFFMCYLKSSWLATANFNELNIVLQGHGLSSLLMIQCTCNACYARLSGLSGNDGGTVWLKSQG